MYLRMEWDYGDNVSSSPKHDDYVWCPNGTRYHVKKTPPRRVAGWPHFLEGPCKHTLRHLHFIGRIHQRERQKSRRRKRSLQLQLKGHDEDMKCTPKQGCSFATFLLGTKQTVLAVCIILTNGEYDFATQTGLSNDILETALICTTSNHSMQRVWITSSFLTRLPIEL